MPVPTTAIITGAGQGIGFEIARQLSAKGIQVALNDINPGLCADAAAAVMSETGNPSIALEGDAADPQFIRHMIDATCRHFGTIDIVIANAGITLFGDFFSYSYADFMEVMRVNLAGSFFLVQAATNVMKTQGTGGSVLFTSSVTGHQAHKQLAAYGMSKAALEMLAKHLVLELSPYGINVNAIAPGATLTERTLNDPAYAATWARLTPLGRAADVSNIADAATFLVSPQARHITGQTLVIDGGWTSVSPSPFHD